MHCPNFQNAAVKTFSLSPHGVHKKSQGFRTWEIVPSVSLIKAVESPLALQMATVPFTKEPQKRRQQDREPMR